VATLWTLAAGIVIVLLPRLAWRRAAARGTSRLLLHLIGMPVSVIGGERLPNRACIIVANHASYLDGIVLTAALPPRFAFVIKHEMSSFPLAGLLLRRLGSLFVNRFDNRAVVGDTGQILRSAVRGEALGIFPEGTFTPEPGLRPFRAGAFIAAVRGRLPVVPVAIRGSRHCLPARSWRPVPGPIEVELGQAIEANGRHRQDAAELARRARAQLRDMVPEPDLEIAAGPCKTPQGSGEAYQTLS
jgi:1-acyl-sn-glycerol-3-phosphate acyltransferase